MSSTASISESVGSVASTTITGPAEGYTSPMPPSPAPTQGPGDGDGQNMNRPIASSAALYLYTFLATLFLLLAVSGVIVIRSFLLRRRHRRLVEEAIRNGTWVPPPPPLNARTPRVDLSKKPVMWEAYLGGNEKENGYGGSYGGSASHEDVKDWDTIKPVSAAYLAPRPSPDHSGGFKAPSNATPVPTTTRATSMITSGLRAIPRYAWSGLRWMAGYPAGHGASSDMPPQNGANGMGDTSGNTGTMENPPSTGPDGGPPVVRVAVIIAMPQQAKPTTASSTALIPNPSTGTLSPANNSHPLQHPSTSSQSHPPDWDEEEPLPVMEMGVAELVMAGQEIPSSSGMGMKDPHGRDSASIRTVEV